MNNYKNPSVRRIFLSIGIPAVLIAVLAFVYLTFGARPAAGEKLVTIEVISQTQETVTYSLHTDAEYLRQAMEETEGLTFSGTEGSFGLMIDTVNGVRADYRLDHAYWSILVNGEYASYGIDTQPVADGDAFTIAYTPAQ